MAIFIFSGVENSQLVAAINMLKSVKTALCIAENELLRSKLVMHRGWHRMPWDSKSNDRPIENTRQAYLDSVTLGMKYAECDVRATKDGVIVLCHNENFSSLAIDETAVEAVTNVKDLCWKDIESLKLKDGSTPTLLATVLEDLKGTETSLIVELKALNGAEHLAKFLSSNISLLPAVGAVMSFNFLTIEAFNHYFLVEDRKAVITRNFPVVWIVGSLTEDVDPDEDLAEGEARFDIKSESFETFLSYHSFTERFTRMNAGVYLQYYTAMTAASIESVASSLTGLLGCDRKDVFMGIWSDRILSARYDNRIHLSELSRAVDVLNTDLPSNFFVTDSE